MRVFVTRRIADAGLQLLKDAGLEVEVWAEKRKLNQDELIHACSQADALISAGQALNEEFMESCSHLKAIALHSVGYDNVDIAAATRLGIPVGNTPGVLSESTADTAFLLMQSVARNAFYMHKTIGRGEWGFFEPTANLGQDLSGLTLGIFGLGKIGYEMARKCRGAFGMKVIYHNRKPNEQAEKELNAEYVSFDDLLQNSDVLSVHTELTPQTKHKFDETAFKQMKPTAIFVNTARGSIHVETDLKIALEKEIIWGAGLDVTNPEPMQPENPLLEMPRVAILPHIGSATLKTRTAMSRLAAENIIAVAQGRQMAYQVNASPDV